MRARACLSLAVCGALLVGGRNSPASERSGVPAAPGPGVPVVEFRQHVRALWDGERYDELEKVAERSRAGKLRCADGYWQIAHFYDVLRRRDDATDREMWLEMIEKAQSWVSASPRSVTAKVVLAGAWSGYAWYSRGPGDATAAIDPEEQALFLERLGKARAILEAAQQQSPSDPHLFHIMQYVARGEGWPRPRYEALFQNAVRLEPTYYSYYYEKTTYLLPKWYGRPGDLAKFAAEAGDAVGSPEGDVIYALVTVGAYFGTLDKHEFKNTAFFEDQGFSWTRAKRGFEEFDRRYPASPTSLNCFALLACIGKDKVTTRTLLDRLGSYRQRGYWPNEGMFEQCRDWSHDANQSGEGWLESLLLRVQRFWTRAKETD
jgi:hypothetical protein